MKMWRTCLRHSFSCPTSNLQTAILKDVKTLMSRNEINISRCYTIKVTNNCANNTERIYYGPLTPQIKGVKVFSLSSSFAGLVAQPIIIREAATIGSTSLLIAICSVVGFFTFITPILLNIITKKYVTEIHYDPDTSTFTATTINFFLAQKQLKFKSEDVEVPDIPGMFTTLNAKGKALFIEARHFNDPIYYAKLMGYDKPMDFKLGEIEDSDEKNK